jgi:hypothetical protein
MLGASDLDQWVEVLQGDTSLDLDWLKLDSSFEPFDMSFDMY